MSRTDWLVIRGDWHGVWSEQRVDEMLNLGSAVLARHDGLPGTVVLVRTEAQRKGAPEHSTDARESIHAHRWGETAFGARDHRLRDASVVTEPLLAKRNQPSRSAQLFSELDQLGRGVELAPAGDRVAPIVGRPKRNMIRSRRACPCVLAHLVQLKSSGHDLDIPNRVCKRVVPHAVIVAIHPTIQAIADRPALIRRSSDAYHAASPVLRRALAASVGRRASGALPG